MEDSGNQIKITCKREETQLLNSFFTVGSISVSKNKNLSKLNDVHTSGVRCYCMLEYMVTEAYGRENVAWKTSKHLVLSEFAVLECSISFFFFF